MGPLKQLLGTLAGFAILALIFLALVGWTTVTDSGSMVARHRLNAALSESDHLRNLNNQLSRQLERQKWEEQMR